MHPILAHTERILVYLVAWLILGFLFMALTALSGQAEWIGAAMFILPLTIVYAFVCLSAWYLCRAFPLDRTPFSQLILTFIVAAAVASSFEVLVSNGWRWMLGQSGFIGASAILPTISTQLFFGIGVMLFLLGGAAQYLIVAFEDSRAAERRVFELKLLAQEAELKALRSQIDPHFLFNSLNSVSALTTKNPHAARNMTLLLADFFRKSLKFGANESITLEEELSLAASFLEIEKIRFGTRLRVETAVEEAAKICRVPSLLLQPVLENSIAHGIAHLVDGGTIRIQAHRNGSRLNVKVENPCDPDRPKRTGTGVGLENVRMRLRSLYDAEARLDVYEDKRVFRVELSLPIQDAPVK